MNNGRSGVIRVFCLFSRVIPTSVFLKSFELLTLRYYQISTVFLGTLCYDVSTLCLRVKTSFGIFCKLQVSLHYQTLQYIPSVYNHPCRMLLFSFLPCFIRKIVNNSFHIPRLNLMNIRLILARKQGSMLYFDHTGKSPILS